MKDLAINYLVDTGPLVGLFDADDTWHQWSYNALAAVDSPLLTTEMVITEACHLLRKHPDAVQKLLVGIEKGLLRTQPILADGIMRVRELKQKYEHMDLADASLVVLSEWQPRARLITIDRRDFTVYRRNDGNPVPCIMP